MKVLWGMVPQGVSRAERGIHPCRDWLAGTCVAPTFHSLSWFFADFCLRDLASVVRVSAQRIARDEHLLSASRLADDRCWWEETGNAPDAGFRGRFLNPHRQVDNVAGWVDPNHEAERFPLLGSRLDFIQASCGQVHGGGFQEPIEVTYILEVLDCHGASPSPRNLGRDTRQDGDQLTFYL